MPTCSLQDLETILKNYTRDGPDGFPTIESCVSKSIEIPFNLKPEDFLLFAESDLKNNDLHHLINGLSNVKRAIECQIDSLFIAFGLFKKSKKEYWKFPRKLEVLNHINIISPRILVKINRLRNLLEHDYSIPDRNSVEDALDVAILFIKYTNKYIYNAVVECSLNCTIDVGSGYSSVQLDYENSKLIFGLIAPEPDGTESQFIEVDIDVNNPKYLDYLSWYVRMLDEREKKN